MKGVIIMKTKQIVLGIICMVCLAGCSDNFLSKEPYSSTLTQAQYERLSNTMEASMRGVYSTLYAYSDHDQFGKRSIDMYCDITSSDMALTSQRYGWFGSDEAGMSATGRTGYIWVINYSTMRNINKVIKLVNDQSDLLSRIAEFGLPNTYNSKKESYYTIGALGDTLASFSTSEANTAYIYAQALTMRGYIYSQMINLYTLPAWRIAQEGGTLGSTIAFPVYNETNMDEAQPLASVEDAYSQVENDLENAIAYFEAFGETNQRTTKLEVDVNVARGLLAYSYLNKGNQYGPSKEPYKNALKYAKEVIASGDYNVLPNAEVLTNGFNNVNSKNWMWGQDVTTETATGLGSFFGQVDIHSYSYAWAGDTKAIDANLYDLIPTFDIRKQWFNDGTKDSKFQYTPDKKFFSEKNPTSTEDMDIDREWLSDNVFMRYESMYLIAAEASYRIGEMEDAKTYLTALTDERVSADLQAEYDAYKAGLNANNLLNAIEYNWRVEMWGEGYGLQTLLRLGNDVIDTNNKRKRGKNHCLNSGAEIDPTSYQYTFIIPSSETSYNPAINGGTKLD